MRSWGASSCAQNRIRKHGGGRQHGQSNRVLPNEVMRAGRWSPFTIWSYNAFVSWIYPEWNVSKLYKRHIFIQELGKGHQPLQPQWGRSRRRLHLVHQNDEVSKCARVYVRQRERVVLRSVIVVLFSLGCCWEEKEEVPGLLPSHDVTTSIICTKRPLMTCLLCAV